MKRIHYYFYFFWLIRNILVSYRNFNIYLLKVTNLVTIIIINTQNTLLSPALTNTWKYISLFFLFLQCVVLEGQNHVGVTYFIYPPPPPAPYHTISHNRGCNCAVQFRSGATAIYLSYCARSFQASRTLLISQRNMG